MISRVLTLLSALSLAWPWPVLFRAPATPQPEALPGLQLVLADEAGVTLSLHTPQYDLQPAGRDQHLTVPGYAATGQPGAPQVPMVNALIGVPPGARVVLEVQEVVSQEVGGQVRLAPVPGPAPLDGDLQAGSLQVVPDQDAYNRDAPFPAVVAEVVDEAWVRDQRVVRLGLYPFQYNPASGRLTWHPFLQVRVRFLWDSPASAGQGTRCLGDCRQPNPMEGALQANLLNYEQARNWRGRPQAVPGPFATAGPLETRYKITVEQDGLYRLTHTDLVNAGLDLNAVDPRDFRLTSQSREVAVYITGEIDGRFDPGDELFFYGQKFRGDLLALDYADWMEDWLWLCGPCQLSGMLEKYTDQNVYWLWVNGPAGPRMATVNGDPSGSGDPIPDYYTEKVVAEESSEWYTHHFTSEDTWFWEQINASTPFTRTYTATLTALASGPLTATVRAEIVSRKDIPGHHTTFYLNDGTQPIDDAFWDGKARHAFEVQVPQVDLQEGVNALHFVAQENGIERMYFDKFEITYGRQFVARGDQLPITFNAAGTWHFQVESLNSPGVTVLDVTSPLTPTHILNPAVTPDGPTYTAAFRATTITGTRLLVAGDSAILSPPTPAAYTPTDFSALPGAEMVFITHPDLAAALQPLVDYRAAQGYSTLVVPVDELYDQFNYGIYHPVSFKNFLSFALANWSVPPVHVLLVGGGHWNLKGYSGYANPTIYMPPNLAFVDPWQGEVDSANLLATVVGDDFMPDLSIARLPAESPAELSTLIDKTIAYEALEHQPWQDRVLFVADNTPDVAGDFVALADGIINDYVNLSGYMVADRIYMDDYCAPGGDCSLVNGAITSTLNLTGTLVVNFLGHASVQNWAHEDVFVNADIPTLTNGDELPVILSMTCLDGYWIHPDLRPSLIMEMLFTPGKGGVGSFSATGLGVATGHDLLQRGFFAALLQDNTWQLGQAALAAKLNLWLNGTGFSDDLMHTFMVFGDPALHLGSPYGADLQPATASQLGSPGTTVQYNLLLTNSGVLSDTYTVTVGGNVWPTSLSLTTAGPLLPAGQQNLLVTVDIPPTGFGADTATVQVISQSDPFRRAAATLVTFADPDQVFLPLVDK